MGITSAYIYLKMLSLLLFEKHLLPTYLKPQMSYDLRQLNFRHMDFSSETQIYNHGCHAGSMRQRFSGFEAAANKACTLLLSPLSYDVKPGKYYKRNRSSVLLLIIFCIFSGVYSLNNKNYKLKLVNQYIQLGTHHKLVLI